MAEDKKRSLINGCAHRHPTAYTSIVNAHDEIDRIEMKNRREFLEKKYNVYFQTFMNTYPEEEDWMVKENWFQVYNIMYPEDLK